MAKNWVVIVLLLGFRVAVAQEEITEDVFLRELSPDHPALVALRVSVGDAEAAVARARTLDNPELAAGVEAPRDLSTQTTWSLAWTPPLDGRRGLRVDAAESSLEGARLDLASAELRLRVEARAAYAGWSVAQRRRDLLAGQLVVVERIARHVRARANAGEASGLSARRVELAVGEERAELARAESMLVQARAAVRALHPHVPAGARPAFSTLPATAIAIDPGARPDVQARLRDAQSFEFEAREARRYLTFPALQFGWQRIEQSGLQWSGPVYGFAWQIPLFDRRQGDRLASTRRLDAARAQAELATRRSHADAEGAESAYTVLRDAAVSAAGSMEDGDRLVESAAAAYDLGEADTTDLLETLRSVLRARLTALELHADALAAHRALEIAAGRPLLSSEGDNQ
jgi:cobalt-zinc-cadmium efflux system outer membrane protein